MGGFRTVNTTRIGRTEMINSFNAVRDALEAKPSKSKVSKNKTEHGHTYEIRTQRTKSDWSEASTRRSIRASHNS